MPQPGYTQAILRVYKETSVQILKTGQEAFQEEVTSVETQDKWIQLARQTVIGGRMFQAEESLVQRLGGESRMHVGSACVQYG